MIKFKVLNNISDLNELNNWEIPLSSKNDQKLFSEQGKEVQSSFAGRQYRLYKRGHHTSGWEKFGLSLLVIFTFGIALSSKYVFKALIKGRVTENFAVCVNPQSTKQKKKEPQDLVINTQKTSLDESSEESLKNSDVDVQTERTKPQGAVGRTKPQGAVGRSTVIILKPSAPWLTKMNVPQGS